MRAFRLVSALHFTAVLMVALFLFAARGEAAWVDAGLGIANVTALVETPGDATVWYAGTSEGRVYKYDGAVLYDVSLGLPGTGVLALAFDATGGTLFAGMGGGAGLYATVDGGVNWWFFGLNGYSVMSVVMDPASAGSLYAVTDFGVKYYDAATTAWSDMAMGGLPSVTALMIDPVDTNIMYAGTSASGVWMSIDGGASWTEVNEGIDAADMDIAFLASYPLNPGVMFAGSNTGVLYRSDRGGNAWYQWATELGGVWSMAYSLPAADYIYAGNQYGISSLSLSGPDLVVSEATLPAIVNTLDTVPLSFTVTNHGGAWKAPATGSYAFYVEFYLSTDSTLGTGDYKIGTSSTIKEIGTGASFSESINVTIPSGVNATMLTGNYSLIAHIVCAYMEDSDMSNNVSIFPVVIGNQSPVACAPDIVREGESPTSNAVILDASCSSDPDGDQLAYEWADSSGNVISTDVTATVSVPYGVSSVTLTVSDGIETVSNTVTVTIEDTTPPAITISGVADGGRYAFGLVPAPSYAVTDATSGVASSTDAITGGDGQGLGFFTYTVTADDTAGNQAEESVTYEVYANSAGLDTYVDSLGAADINPEAANTLTLMIGTAQPTAIINQINAELNAGRITAEAAAQLIHILGQM